MSLLALIAPLQIGLLAATAPGAAVTQRPIVPKTTAVLAGHVVDESGEPFPSAQVRATRWEIVAGKRRFTQSQGGGVDADGYFLIAGLEPGTYTVDAHPDDLPNAVGGAEACQPTDLEGDIELRAGSEVRNLRIALRKAHAFGVSGTAVHAATGERIADAPLVLRAVEPKDAGSHYTRIRAGTFKFTNVLPGTYFVETNPDGLTRDDETGGYRKLGLCARLQVVVGDSDLSGVEVQLGPGSELTGSFRMHDGAVPPGAGLMLTPVEGIGPILGLRAQPDGAFRLTNVPPDRYRLRAGAPQDSYVLSIRADGQEIGDTLDLTAGGAARLQILLAPNGALISGRLRSTDENVEVVLWKPGRIEPRYAAVGQDGSFTFRNLAPGEYRVMTLENAGLIEPEDLDTWKTLESQAVAVTVAEGARVAIVLPPGPGARGNAVIEMK